MKTVKKLNVAFVIDRSGSMYPMKDEVIKGFNRVLEEHGDPEVLFTVCVFSDDISFPEVRTPADKVAPLDGKSYAPDGCTALNDAMGKTVTTLAKLTEEGEKVLFFVMTDGMENASTDYTTRDIRELVKKQTRKGWEFVFLGANISAEEEAEKRGISRSNNFVADDKGAKLVMCAMSEGVRRMRDDEDLADFDAELKEDYDKRGR
ncbi:MAG: VWA domain-containing protein [Abditibacteriota bacterium]|nr:VWA domain-containing protein [Abditibacteriota bacterium]